MPSDREKQDLLTFVDQGADRLTRPVEKLLYILRIEHGQLELDLRPAEPLPLLRRGVNEMCAAGKNIALNVKGDPEPCLLDPDRLWRSFASCRKTRLNPPSDSPVDAEVEDQEFEYMVSVTDRGIGFPEEDREHFFDRIYQVEKARYHSKPGMGMGLYIAREIIERHSVRIGTNPGRAGIPSSASPYPARW